MSGIVQAGDIVQSREGRLDNQCAGLVQMARDRDAALAENRALAEAAK